MVLYLIALMMGFVLAGIYIKRRPSQFEENLLRQVAAGKRVIVSIDDEAYIFESIDGKMRVTKGLTNYTPEPIDVNVDNLQSSKLDYPDDISETLPEREA